jgi:GNAT superfamily N-acetyltransferase
MALFQPVQVQDDQQLAHFCQPAGLPPLLPPTGSGSQADARWMLIDASDEVAARCSLWWRNAPPYPPQRVGLIGHYAARDSQAAAQLLHLACAQLAGHGCTLAVGPVDGSTWQRYRLVIERGSAPLFFLEPDNPDAWPGHFSDSGFTILSRYLSTLKTDLAEPAVDLSRADRRAAGRGIRFRPAALDHFEEELRQIYRLSLASFRRNFLYTPLAEAEFMSMYRPLRPYLRPELILLAEQAGRPVGFLFALPDWLQAQRGETVDTVIIKTVAVQPQHQVGGLGSLLVARCHEMAHQLGYRRAIHTLMHEQNSSRKISRRNGTVTIRQYALFARSLR